MHKPSIMLVAGEASGDMYGARLAKAIRKKRPDVSLCGMGAGDMRGAGVEILYNASDIAVVGLVEVIGHARHIWAAMKILKSKLATGDIDLLVLIDLPDFNLKLAAFAKKMGIPILYFISPQIWAWRTGRVHKIRRLVDRMAVILPFEKEFYQKFGVMVDFVGHPLIDLLPGKLSKSDDQKGEKQSPPVTVGLMPGSRNKEIDHLLPLYCEAAKQLLAKLPETQFYLFLAPGMESHAAFRNVPKILEERLQFIDADRYYRMQSCHAIIVASGTATLELALLDVPMVVTYRVSPLTYFLARRLIKVKYVSLVNLVADGPVVPELLQTEANPRRIAEDTLRILLDEGQRHKMLAGLQQVRKKLGSPGATARAAEIALDMIGSQPL